MSFDPRLKKSAKRSAIKVPLSRFSVESYIEEVAYWRRRSAGKENYKKA
jgi:hypothetical protein